MGDHAETRKDDLPMAGRACLGERLSRYERALQQTIR